MKVVETDVMQGPSAYRHDALTSVETAWSKAQLELSAASQSYHRLKTLPSERKRMIGLAEYRKRCKAAHLALKLADERCTMLLSLKRVTQCGP